MGKIMWPHYALFPPLVVVQLLNHIQLFVTPWTAGCQGSLSSLSLRVCSNSCPLSQWSYLSISFSAVHFSLALNLSKHQSFYHQVTLHIRWQKYWSFSISPSNEYSGFISFRIDWLDLFAVQETLKTLKHHNLKVSVLRCSAFFIQHSNLYMTTEKTTALTITDLCWQSDVSSF